MILSIMAKLRRTVVTELSKFFTPDFVNHGQNPNSPPSTSTSTSTSTFNLHLNLNLNLNLNLKKQTMLKKIIFLASLFVAVNGLSAQDAQVFYSPDQDTSRLWRIETRDGNEFFGTIAEQNEREIKLKTESLGVITIQLSNIKSMKEIRPELIREGELWTENPQATRYLWGPSGYGLKKGEGYYQNIWIFFNQASFGITDNVSIGVGMIPLFLFAGAPTPIWITPKVSVPVVKDKFNVGGGALIGTVLGEDVGGPFGIAYGIATVGSRDKNFSFGIGYGFADGEWGDIPTFSLNGMIRIGKRGYILTENYFISAGGETVGLISLGGRTVWSKIALDYGGILPVGSETEAVIVPWLGISIPFGR
jgi:hypothetical protein